MKNLFIILVICYGFSQSVVSQNTLRLEPLAADGKIVNGREYIPLSNAEIRVELGYDGKLEEKFLFDLVVFNNSSHAISLSPSSFYFLELDDPDADSSRFPPRVALAPKQPYKWYDRSIEEPGCVNAFASFIEIPALFIEAFSESFANGAPPGSTPSELQRLDRLKDAIRQEMMQEREIEAGEVANGYVLFPSHEGAEYLLFCFPVDDQEFQFVYRQTKTP